MLQEFHLLEVLPDNISIPGTCNNKIYYISFSVGNLPFDEAPLYNHCEVGSASMDDQ